MIQVYGPDGAVRATYDEDEYLPEYTIRAMISAGYTVKIDGKKWSKKVADRGRGPADNQKGK